MAFLTPIRIARIGIFVALAIVGSFIKVPSSIGTPALDSAPGYFSSLAFGVLEGFIVAALGHILTSYNVGFPLGFLHILIAVGMGICAILFRLFYERFNIVVSIVLVTIVNGVLLPLLVVPFFGIPVYVGLIPSVVLASALNLVLAGGIYEGIKKGSSYKF